MSAWFVGFARKLYFECGSPSITDDNTDPFLNFTKAIGADVDKSGRGLGIRSNRYTMLVDDMKVVKLQEEKDTGSCEISAAENFLELV